MVRWYFTGLALSFFGTSARLRAGLDGDRGCHARQQRTPTAAMGRVSATAMSIAFGAVPVGLAAGALLVATVSFQAIYVIIAVITAAMWARGGRARRFTAREAPAWQAADQME